MSPQRWAVIGTGTISRSVVPDLMSCDGADVVIVHSRDAAKAERFAREFEIPDSTSDYDAILDDDTIGAIYLATPFATHHSMAAEALRAGKHILIEKPMAMNADEVADLFDIAARQGVFLMEAMWMKFGPAYRSLLREIAEGTIGVPGNIQANFSIPFPADGGSKWDVSRSGGALLDQGIYPVTLALGIFGEPVGVVAAGSVRSDGLDIAEHFTLEFGDGRYAQGGSGMAGFSDLSASIGGTRGWITLSAPFWATTEVTIHAGSTDAIFGSPAPIRREREGNGYVPMIREVIEAIEAGVLVHPVHPAADTLGVFRTLDAIFDQIRPRIALTETI